MRLSQHPRPIPTVRPPYEYVAKYLVKDPRGSGHVFWRDGRANHGHDDDGQALLKWKVRPTAQTHMVSRGVYSVVRLLLEHQKMNVENVQNGCGLPQCVNIHHWTAMTRLPRLRIVFGAAQWGVQDVRTGALVSEAAVRVRGLDDVVHVARAAPPALVAVCGAALDPATAVIVEAIPTCKGGC